MGNPCARERQGGPGAVEFPSAVPTVPDAADAVSQTNLSDSADDPLAIVRDDSAITSAAGGAPTRLLNHAAAERQRHDTDEAFAVDDPAARDRGEGREGKRPGSR